MATIVKGGELWFDDFTEILIWNRRHLMGCAAWDVGLGQLTLDSPVASH